MYVCREKKGERLTLRYIMNYMTMIVRFSLQLFQKQYKNILCEKNDFAIMQDNVTEDSCYDI